MVKKKELAIDEKPKTQVWTVAGVKTAEIAARKDVDNRRFAV
jgi:hypothetical protein